MTNGLLALLLALKIITMQYALHDMAVREGVDPRLAACIVEHESEWDVNRLGALNEIGLMQLLPSTAEWALTKLDLPADTDLWQPVNNLSVGLWILDRYPEWYSTLYLCE